MAFYETQFPPNISIKAQGGPGYRTDVVVVSSGREQRNITWSQQRHRYDVAQAARRHDLAEQIKAFFHVMMGQAHGFRFKDWNDYKATGDEGKFVAGQMVKRYAAGATTRDRTISKPVSGTLVGVGGSLGTIDYTTGIMTGGTATGWTGEFDVPCRFGVDELIADIVDRRKDGELILEWNSIPIVEIRV